MAYRLRPHDIAPPTSLPEAEAALVLCARALAEIAESLEHSDPEDFDSDAAFEEWEARAIVAQRCWEQKKEELTYYRIRLTNRAALGPADAEPSAGVEALTRKFEQSEARNDALRKAIEALHEKIAARGREFDRMLQEQAAEHRAALKASNERHHADRVAYTSERSKWREMYHERTARIRWICARLKTLGIQVPQALVNPGNEGVPEEVYSAVAAALEAAVASGDLVLDSYSSS